MDFTSQQEKDTFYIRIHNDNTLQNMGIHINQIPILKQKWDVDKITKVECKPDCKLCSLPLARKRIICSSCSAEICPACYDECCSSGNRTERARTFSHETCGFCNELFIFSTIRSRRNFLEQEYNLTNSYNGSYWFSLKKKRQPQFVSLMLCCAQPLLDDICQKCGKIYCHRCYEEKQRKDDKHICKKENLDTALLIREITKPCPSCLVPIEKASKSSCNLMECTNCNACFEWNNLRILSGAIDSGKLKNYMALFKYKTYTAPFSRLGCTKLHEFITQFQRFTHTAFDTKDICLQYQGRHFLQAFVNLVNRFLISDEIFNLLHEYYVLLENTLNAKGRNIPQISLLNFDFLACMTPHQKAQFQAYFGTICSLNNKIREIDQLFRANFEEYSRELKRLASILDMDKRIESIKECPLDFFARQLEPALSFLFSPLIKDSRPFGDPVPADTFIYFKITRDKTSFSSTPFKSSNQGEPPKKKIRVAK